VTLAWEEPVSSLYASIQQQQAEDELNDLEANYPTPGDLRAIAGIRSDAIRTKILARRLRERIEKGDAIGRMKIDRMDLDIVMVQGTDDSTLRRGPGHYPGTKLPGEHSTAGIAGHRTTYLAPFRNINKLQRGDEIVLEMPYGDLTYAVQRHAIVPPSRTQIVRPVGYDRIVLTACHPLYSASKRYVIFARLTGISGTPEA
jgi:sortase A